jgi:hypothetical protein
MVDVAPREIRDYVYRATRPTGVDHGVADAIARAAVFAHIQLDSHLANVLDALERAETPMLGLEYVAAAVGASDQTVAAPDGLVVADLALFAWEACKRGTQVHLTCPDGERRSPNEWLSVGRAQLAVSKLDVVIEQPNRSGLARVETRRQHAFEVGARIDQGAWSRLVALAAGYLVSESDIDALG